MKKNGILKNFIKVFVIIFIILAVVIGILCHKMNGTVKNVTQLDDEGLLYSLDYVGDYDNAFTQLPTHLVEKFGCSAFCTHNMEGDAITARNYDLPHKDDDGNITGLNVVVKLNPEGKYSSINIADAAWFTTIGIPYTAGALNKSSLSNSFLTFLPYLCMDGMNEKGLTASILYLDVKEGENAVKQCAEGKESVGITEILRLVLDNCASVEEAADFVKNYNMTNILDSDYHLFVTDAKGNGVVMEWRYNELYLTYQDAVTNFYVAFDDAEDCYEGDQLKDAFVKAEGLTKEYHYGYGHGYSRFKTIAETLNEHISDPVTLATSMTEGEAMNTLKAVSQVYDGTELTSNTEYSVIYNSTDLSADVCVMRDYRKHYYFSFDR